MNDTRFRDLANTFELTKERIENMSPADATSVRVLAFYALVANFLDMFESYPDLQRISLEHSVSVDVSSSTHLSIAQSHQVRVSAPQVGLGFEVAPEEHEAYVVHYVPYRIMGPGSFELTRDDPRVVRFLALNETQHGLWTGLVAEIASQMDLQFGNVRTRHSLA